MGGGLLGGLALVLIFWGIGWDDGFSIHAFVADLVVNLLVYVAGAVIGAVVGLVVGLFRIFRAERTRSRSTSSATPSPGRSTSPPIAAPLIPHTREPGWYPDPWGATRLRWWEGSRWTDRVQSRR